jgi:hypothetical protein
MQNQSMSPLNKINEIFENKLLELSFEAEKSKVFPIIE